MSQGIRLTVLFALCFLLHEIHSYAQCNSPISVFPYNQNFEASQGGWSIGAGSISPSWGWGTPIKPVINRAGQGSKCWITGGLTGSSYNSNEFSWIQSPCFNLSALSNPQISFLVFWETERRYDGATFQYSTDNGASWTTLGTINSNNNCTGTNWYTFSPINFLGSQPGWSGNIQPTVGSCQGGNGSGDWIRAQHSLSSISPRNQVIFRFLFAAGQTCNQFDGFAMDDVLIEDAPPAGSVDFIGNCLGGNRLSFTNQNTLCRTSVFWDFDDPSSGASNVDSGDNVNHTFSGPGTYQVKMTVTFVDGQTSVKIKSFTVLSSSASVVQPIRCKSGNDGAVSVTVSGGSGPYFFNWNTNPPQTTAIATQLTAGTYIVNSAAINACSINDTIVLTEPDSLSVQALTEDEVCSNSSGSIQLSVSGGTPAYAFQWSNGAVSKDLDPVTAGNYSVQITDANGCILNSTPITVNNTTRSVNVFIGPDTFICPGSRLILDPGVYASYLWQDGSVSQTYAVTASGIYSVQVTDEDGCLGSASRKVTVDCSEIYFPGAFSPNNDGLNDSYGPVGNLSAVSRYSLKIFNRFGQLIFTSGNPYDRWDGLFQGRRLDMQVFTWVAGYFLNGKDAGVKKGNFLLLQ